MKTGVIIATLGGPRHIDEVPEFIKRFLGRELPAPALKAVIERYRIIGGFSPLTRITADQATKLNLALGNDYLCRPAFRYTTPFIPDAIDSIIASGMERILFLLLTPFYTSATTGEYIAHAQRYAESIALSLPISFIHSWHSEPLFIESWVEKIRNEHFDEQAYYLFSAHSLPLRLSDEPYRKQIEETAELVASRAGIVNWALGWQSVPASASEPWITPSVEEKMEEIAAAGFKSIVVVPIGFTADHIETLYDIDIAHRQYALAKGLLFRRISSLNAGDTFIRALTDIVRKQQ